MSRNTKIVLGVIAGIVGLCCLVAVVVAIFLPRYAERFADEAFAENPEEAAAVGEAILQYDLPAGFSEQTAMSFFGMNMVFITDDRVGENDASVIMIMSFPESFAGDPDRMQQQMEESFTQQSGRGNVDFQFAGSEDIVINDMNTTLNYYEGQTEGGVTVRQATAVFESDEGGPGMLMVVSPTDRWEQANIDSFIDSLR